MLDNIVSGLMVKVLECFYGGDESKTPTIDYLGVMPAVPSLHGAHVLLTGNEVKLTPPASLPAASTGCRSYHQSTSLHSCPLCWPEDCHPPAQQSAQPILLYPFLWTMPTRFSHSRHPLCDPAITITTPSQLPCQTTRAHATTPNISGLIHTEHPALHHPPSPHRLIAPCARSHILYQPFICIPT